MEKNKITAAAKLITHICITYIAANGIAISLIFLQGLRPEHADIIPELIFSHGIYTVTQTYYFAGTVLGLGCSIIASQLLNNQFKKFKEAMHGTTN